jgi:hypothetical protein
MAKRHRVKPTPHDTASSTYRIAVHYLFDLDYPPETVAKIVDMSVDYVRGVEKYESRCRV